MATITRDEIIEIYKQEGIQDQYLEILKSGTSDIDHEFYMNAIRHFTPMEESNIVFLMNAKFDNGILEKIGNLAHSQMKCNTCTYNAKFLASLYNSYGTVFLNDPNIRKGSIYKKMFKIANSGNITDEITVITKSTFPDLNTSKHVIRNNFPCFHYSMIPSKTTSDESYLKFNSLQQDFRTINTRLEKFLAPGFIADLKIMENELIKCVRPDHWRGVIQWVKNIQRFANNTDWLSLTKIEQARIKIMAIMTGRSSSGIHLDYKQSSNLIDFSEDATSINDIHILMDTRSNPETYMVSQLANQMANRGITSKYSVGLCWQTADDLDIHVICPDKSKVYYGMKSNQYAELDFDANECCRRIEDCPCENVSFKKPGEYIIYVDNYQWSNSHTDIQFTLVIRGHNGTYNVSGIWPKYRQNRDLMEVARYTHVITDTTPMNISVSTANKLSASEQEFKDRFGELKSRVISLSDVPDDYICWKSDEPDLLDNSSSSVTNLISDLISNATDIPLSGKDTYKLVKKKSLSERLTDNPTTFTGLIKLLSNNKHHNLTIDARNCVPGYLTKVTTKTDVLKDKCDISPCCFNKKFEYPQKPNIDITSTARMSEDWLINNCVRCKVISIANIQGHMFLTLSNTKIPTNKDVWPLASGMYPTDLTTNNHNHRSRWSAYHISTPDYDNYVDIPMIGSFFINDQLEFNLDGKSIIITK
jgi:hypothetical protein